MMVEDNNTDSKTLEKLKEMATEVCERDGYKLYDVEYISGSGILRVFIDAEGGITLDQCAAFSRGMNLLLDVEDPIPGKYNLEVSSPGLERVLRQKWHYDEQKGKKVKVVLKARTSTISSLGKKQVEGVLQEVSDEGILLQNFEDQLIPYGDIHKANLIFDYDKNFKNI